MTLNNLALLYTTQGRYEDAEHLGTVYLDQGRYVDAELVLRKSLAIIEEALGPNNLALTMKLRNLAVALLNQQRLAEAYDALRRSGQILSASLEAIFFTPALERFDIVFLPNRFTVVPS